MSNKRIKLRFGVAVALVIVCGSTCSWDPADISIVIDMTKGTVSSLGVPIGADWDPTRTNIAMYIRPGSASGRGPD